MSTNYDFVVTSGGIGPTYAPSPFSSHQLPNPPSPCRPNPNITHNLTHPSQARRHNLPIHRQSLLPPPDPPRRSLRQNEEIFQTTPLPTQLLLGRTLCRPNRQTPHDRAPHRHLPAPFQTSALPRLRPLGPRSLHQRKRTRLTWRASTFREIIGWHEAVVG